MAGWCHGPSSKHPMEDGDHIEKTFKLKKIADSTKHTFNSSKGPSIINYIHKESLNEVWQGVKVQWYSDKRDNFLENDFVAFVSFFIELFSEVKKFYVESFVSSNFNITYKYNSCDSLMDCKAF